MNEELEAWWINRLSMLHNRPVHRMVILEVSEYACLMIDEASKRYWVMNYWGQFSSTKNLIIAFSDYTNNIKNIKEILEE